MGDSKKFRKKILGNIGASNAGEDFFYCIKERISVIGELVIG